MSSIDLSVVICTRNQRVGLIETLETVADQKCNGSWEVVVVDNASDDGSAQAVRGLTKNFPVPLEITAETRPGLSHARNEGVARARGDAVLFVDDDVSCLEGWLDAHWQAFDDPSVDATGGPIVPALPPDTPTWLADWLAGNQGGPTARYDFGDIPAEIVEAGEINLPFGCNMGIRRGWIERAGGFRSDLGWGPQAMPGEETYLLRTVLERGGRILYCPAARVVHRIRRDKLTTRNILRWYRGFGRASIRFDGVEPLPERTIGVARDLFRIARHSLLALPTRVDSAAGLDRRRKRERAIGRLIERLAGNPRRA